MLLFKHPTQSERQQYNHPIYNPTRIPSSSIAINPAHNPCYQSHRNPRLLWESVGKCNYLQLSFARRSAPYLAASPLPVLPRPCLPTGAGTPVGTSPSSRGLHGTRQSLPAPTPVRVVLVPPINVLNWRLLVRLTWPIIAHGRVIAKQCP